MTALRNLTLRLRIDRLISAKVELCQSIVSLCFGRRTFKRSINMFRNYRTAITLMFSLSFLSPLFAQTGQPQALTSNPIVTATTSNGKVRYASLGEVHQTRLQVFSREGAQVYDSDFRLGNLIDWTPLDQLGQRLLDGSYLFLVTNKNFSGALTQKYGTVMLESDQLSLQQSGREELPPAQADALQANKLSESFSPVDRLGAAAVTSSPTAANEPANLPENVPPVTQTTIVQKNPGGENLGGTGSQNRIAKWIDGAGNLGDAGILEASGLTFFGQNHSAQVAPLFPTASTYHVVEIGATPGAKAPLTLAGGSGVMEFWKDLGGGTGSPAAAVAFGLARPGGAATNDMVFSTFTPSTWNERMRITTGGNVGIGTNNPGAKLDVVGDLNVVGNAVISGNIAAKYQDVAEWVQARQIMPPGTVVVLDVGQVNQVAASFRKYDPHVAGVVSAQPGLILGERGPTKVLVATTGRVKVKVDARRHPIKIGDLLVTSGQPGVAMRSNPVNIKGTLFHRPGTIIGKALEPLRKGQGEILVLLSLQ